MKKLSLLIGLTMVFGICHAQDELPTVVSDRPGFTYGAAVVQHHKITWDNGFAFESMPDGERTVTLTFGKSFQYLNMTGTLESSSSGARMLFTADKAMAFLKKLATTLGQTSSSIAGIANLANGYDNYRIGFKLAK